MRMISKVTMEKLNLTKGKTYDFEKTPKMFDPDTFNEVIGYLVRNDSGILIKVFEKYNPKWPTVPCLDHFTTLAELRDKKLNDLGI